MLREYSGVVRRCVIQFTGLVFILGSPIALANAELKGGSTLKSFYESSWERQPDYKSYQYRVEAALAKQKIAIVEPNLNILKNCMVPLAICDMAYDKRADLVKEVLCFNSIKY